jgi:hypothetical protein
MKRTFLVSLYRKLKVSDTNREVGGEEFSPCRKTVRPKADRRKAEGRETLLRSKNSRPRVSGEHNLLFNNIFYMLDDFIVFGFSFFTLSRFGFSERYNRYSTLIAGTLILILGVFLIFKPGWLMFA